MKNVLINGCNGKMGHVLADLIENDEELKICCGVDKEKSYGIYPVHSDIREITEKVDIIIDFSVPTATLNILKYAKANKIPIVIATTGFSEEENIIIEQYAKIIPIFKSANMSFEATLLKNIVKEIAPKLKGTDIEITEVHHNKKVDSPSGTAQMLADTINEVLENKYHCEYNRHEKREKRDKYEIGMNSIRGGNIVGEHTVQFFGESETFEIKHTAYSRNVFAEGAIKATKYILNKQPGLYSMEDLIKN